MSEQEHPSRPGPDDPAPPFVPFTQRLRGRGANLIYLVRGNDSTGRPAWYYLQVQPLKKALFESKARKGQIQLTDFGRIVLSGYGEHPPADVKKRMKREYDFEE